VGLTHNPGLDWTFWKRRGKREMLLLFPALPLSLAYFIFQELKDKGEFSLPPGVKLPLEWREVQQAAAPLPFSPLEPSQVRRQISGRILFLEEVQKALMESRAVGAPLEDVLHWLYLQGEIDFRPGVGYDSQGRPICYRCGQNSSIVLGECGACGFVCPSCESCLSLGPSRGCRPLYIFPALEGLTPREEELCLPQLNFALTPAQKDAYGEAKEFVSQGKEGECLLWAACGAGKTEVAYGAIAEALKQGKKVLYACPRREVVKEMEGRMASAWPGLKVVALYGGSPQKFREGDLILATAHQALRFYQKFHLVVLDEADAFPLSADPMLHYALRRARKPGGQILWLTATPSEEMRHMVRRNSLKVIYLPARPHGHPLPVPEFIIPFWGGRLGEGSIPSAVLRCLKEAELAGAQVMIFVPSVAQVSCMERWFLAQIPSGFWGNPWVRGCHAGHPDREEVIGAFRERRFFALITTTLLERGVTIPHVYILVLFAHEEKIFDTNTLVQIAGRAGRHRDYPQGKVWFYGYKVTPSMAEAQGQIREFNRLARQRGYLK